MPTSPTAAPTSCAVVEGVSGTVRMRHEWVVRLRLRRDHPLGEPHARTRRHDDHVITAVAGPDMLVLRGTRLPHAHDGRHVDEFDVAAGERLQLLHDVVTAPTARCRRRSTDGQHRGDTRRAVAGLGRPAPTATGPYSDASCAPLLVLRLLTHAETGGIVAAPTTSLPEDIGGERNWDYRYCWLRDAALTLEALLGSGYVEETQLWRHWLLRAVAGDPEDMQIMYGVDGGRELPERELSHLPGYAGSTPVRVGNGAVDQRQSDVLGEVMIALPSGPATAASAESRRSWNIQRRSCVDELAAHWQEPDNGLWEIRGPLRNFTHSRVMVWAAFDRAVRGVEEHGSTGPVERWRDAARRGARGGAATRASTRRSNTFTQHYGTDEVDASLLLVPSSGSCRPTTRRWSARSRPSSAT